ncbi:NVEALA domain-containing protein [Parabacteroides faecis]|uniref:NVEALA domain-containing protein n=1 Tax=Parabacteroides faecis TaxID=1217282 RepID=UPI0035218DB4
MKRKIFGAALIAAMALAAGWNFNQSKNEVELSDLALANVEALANIEWGAPCSYSHFVCYLIHDEFGWDTIFGDEM